MKKTLSLLAAVCAATFFAGAAYAQAPAAAPAAPGAPATPPPPPKVMAPKSQEAKPVVAGSAFADFQLPFAFENKMAKFSELYDKDGKSAKLTIITFTNTSCASCQDEMQVLTKLKSKYGKDLYIVAVVTDYNAKRIAENLGEDTKKAFTFVTDPYFTVPPIYGFSSTPATVFIKGGKVDVADSGYIPNDAGRKALTEKIAAHMN